MGNSIYSNESTRSKKHSKVGIKKFTFGGEVPRQISQVASVAKVNIDHSVPAIPRNKSVNVAEMEIEDI